MSIKRRSLSFFSLVSCLGLVAMLISPAVAATQIDIPGPEGSGLFGSSVTVLPNGNIVVTDPYYDAGATEDVGAVYLYNGASGELISMLTGSSSGDRVGAYGVTELAGGNYVVRSPYWDNGMATDAGAVTWGDGTTGITGTVSAANSLVGSTSEDWVGLYEGVTALENGNYVVSSSYWDNDMATNAGAVTWGDGTTGITGTISATNSLVGTTAGDLVGADGMTQLDNGNYVVSSPSWYNGAIVQAGAVTWGDGTTGITGTVSAANSLVGTTAGDLVGAYGVTALANGNYVVSSSAWDNGTIASAGAVTWGDGTTGITGAVSAANSLVGSTANDWVGWGLTALANGNYVVSSSAWNNGTIAGAGAVTWGDGTTGITGTINTANSLVGSNDFDSVGYGGVTALENGNYAVSSYVWNNGIATEAGAVTWGSGTTGITGTVSATNSLVGSSSEDWVGGSVTALHNGSYVVSSPDWANGAVAGVGAVTWGDGTTGITGTVSAANSLVGSNDFDYVGKGGVTALHNGNYVVSSPDWANGAVAGVGAVSWGDGTTGITGTVSAANSLVGSTVGDWVAYHGVTALDNGNYVVNSAYWNNAGATRAGAVTWGDGTTGITGTVSAANSLVGSNDFDYVGKGGVTALHNGNYVVNSYVWDNGTIVDAGAVTWGDGTTGITGTVSAANSLVGSTAGDWVAYHGVTALDNGNYVVRSPDWNNGYIVQAGAVTWGDVTAIPTGPITADNSVRGTTENGGGGMNFDYDDVNQQLVVGRPLDNIVTLFRPNRMPLADAGPDQSVLSSSTVTLDGSASYDPDEDLPLAFDWEQSGGTPVSLSGNNVINPTFTAPTVITQTSILTFTLVVSDALGLASLPDEVVITVEPYPVSDAGSDQSVLSSSTVMLDGSGSYDPNGDLPLAFNWEQSGGTPVTLSGSHTANPTFTAPAVTQTSILTFTLVVSNSLGIPSLPDDVVITVEPYPVESYLVLLPVVTNREAP